MLWHIINYFRKKNKLLGGGMQTLALIQLQMHKTQPIKTVPVCCLRRIAACSTLLKLIMVRMSDWALPFMTLSLSLATSSSSGPRGGISVLPHHGLNGEDKCKLFLYTYSNNCKGICLVFLYRRHKLFSYLLISTTFRSHFIHMLQLSSSYKPSMHSTKIFGSLWLPVNRRCMAEQKFTCEKTEDAQRVFCPQRESFLTHLKRMKNLYCSKTVNMKKITPSTAIANKFFPTKSHCRGSRVCFAPKEGKKNKRQTCIYKCSLSYFFMHWM